MHVGDFKQRGTQRPDREGLVPALIGFAGQKGSAAYVGDGSNRWPTVSTAPPSLRETSLRCRGNATILRLILVHFAVRQAQASRSDKVNMSRVVRLVGTGVSVVSLTHRATYARGARVTYFLATVAATATARR
jgi:hypothetical protein